MRFRRKFEPQAAVNLVPMVDVVFQLVLFFLVSTTLALVPGIRLKLPASGTTERVPVRQLVVTIASATELWMNDEPVAGAAELNERLAAMSEDDRAALECYQTVIRLGGFDSSHPHVKRAQASLGQLLAAGGRYAEAWAAQMKAHPSAI